MRNELKEAMAQVGGDTADGVQDDLVAPAEVDSKVLAWAAETADGSRDTTLFLVRDRDGQLWVKEGMDGTDQELRRIRTNSHQPTRRKVLEVSCAVDGWEDPARLPSAQKWDAVFWTESSVEKFLYPYYHSQRLWDAKLESVKDEFEKDPDAVAIAHQAPSNSRVLSDSVLSTIGVARLTTRDGATSLEWLGGAEYLVLRGRQ